MKIGIIGLGYVGRSVAQAAVDAGHSVIGFDTSSDVISSLSISGNFKGTTDAVLLGAVEVVVVGQQKEDVCRPVGAGRKRNRDCAQVG